MKAINIALTKKIASLVFLNALCLPVFAVGLGAGVGVGVGVEEGRYSYENQRSALTKKKLASPKPKHVLTPQWAERYIYKNHPRLMKGSRRDHVMAFYFFGGYDVYTLMGMERVRGDDYHEELTLLVFKDKELVGIYSRLPHFPKGVETSGKLLFPKGVDVEMTLDFKNEELHDLKFHAPEQVTSRLERISAGE